MVARGYTVWLGGRNMQETKWPYGQDRKIMWSLYGYKKEEGDPYDERQEKELKLTVRYVAVRCLEAITNTVCELKLFRINQEVGYTSEKWEHLHYRKGAIPYGRNWRGGRRLQYTGRHRRRVMGAMPPRPPVGAGISHGKCDQLMRLGAAACIMC